MTHSYPKSNRIRKSRQYRFVLSKGSETKGRFLILCAFQNSRNDEVKFGVVASKYFGNATKRNRFKRLSREAFRNSKQSLPKGLQLVLKPRKHALGASMNQILEELQTLTHQILRKT